MTATDDKLSMIKVAFLINAHGNFQHLQRLINALLGYRQFEASVFVHVDAKSRGHFEFHDDRVWVADSRLKVYWGGVSQVLATLLLMREAAAARTDFKYFCFLTGQDYPVKPEEYLAGVFSGTRTYINLVRMPEASKPVTRLTEYWFEHERRGLSAYKFVCRATESVLRSVGIRKRIPFTPYGGSQHFFLHVDCARYILSFCDAHPEFIDFHSTALCPDESFFQTIIGNSPFSDSLAPSLVYANWSAADGNFRFSLQDLEKLKNATAFENKRYGRYSACFARKFFDDGEEMVRAVDRELRHI